VSGDQITPSLSPSQCPGSGGLTSKRRCRPPIMYRLGLLSFSVCNKADLKQPVRSPRVGLAGNLPPLRPLFICHIYNFTMRRPPE
jgi:hypothetical protein